VKLPISQKVVGNRLIQTISLAELLRLIGRSGVWVFIPLYLLAVKDISYIEIGILFLLSAVASIPVSIFGGNLVDKIGRRKIALTVPPVLALLFLLIFLGIHFSLSTLFITIPFVLFAPGAVLQSIVDSVIVTDSTDEMDRIDAFSMTRIGANIGFSLGPAIAGFAVTYNYSILPLIPLVLEIFGFFLYFKYINYNEGPHQEGKKLLSFPRNDRRFIIVSILVSIAWFSVGPWAYILPQFFSRVDLIQYSVIGILFAANGLSVVVLQLPVNRLFYRINDMTRISIGLMIYAVTFALFGIIRNEVLLLINIIFLTVGENVISPASNSIIGKIAPPERRGEYYGGFSLLNNFLSPFSPLFYEAMLAYLFREPVFLWLIIGIICLILALSIMATKKLWKTQESTLSFISDPPGGRTG
jgi:MFS family permease